MGLRRWIAQRLEPQAFADQRSYQVMKAEAADAYHWLRGYPDAADALRWLLDNNLNRNRAIGEKAIGELPPQISDFREHLERRHKAKLQALTPSPQTITKGDQ